MFFVAYDYFKKFQYVTYGIYKLRFMPGMTAFGG